jgi:hypothetical protein
MQTLTDNQLHELARKRVEFKRHLLSYFVTNAAFWLIWYFTGQGYIWPIWLTATWGMGLVFHYLFNYHSSGLFSEDEEFHRLKKQFQGDEGFIE